MSLDDIWNDPIPSPPKTVPSAGNDSPLKRPRESLFLPDSDSDYERPPKRATPAPPSAKPDVDALFDDLDKDDDDDDLRYKPLAPALDLAKLAKEAEERHARGRQAGSSQTLVGSSKTAGAGTAGKDPSEKDKPADGEKKGRKAPLKLNEERLVGPEGFPLLIEEIRGFKPRGKGNEHADLNRLLQVYQFWTHRVYPKTSFKDTIDRVEKLCHSKRMQVRLSVWRDEFNGITNDKKPAEDSDVIDLTEPTLVGIEEGGEGDASQDPRSKSEQVSSRPPSLPPASSEVEDDVFDIDAVIRAEKERLSALRGTTADSEIPHSLPSPKILDRAPSDAGANRMDLDEASLWAAVDDSPMLFEPLAGNPPPSALQVDDDAMWDIVDELERGQSRPAAKMQIPISKVNLIPSLDSAQSWNTSRATNDDDWDDMYS